MTSPHRDNGSSRPRKRPNIVLMMADDMGYSDIGCFGAEIDTPNLNRLAKEGMRFTQMYNAARCCPTRASLLTGLYPHQAGIGHMVGNAGHPSYQGYLNDKCVTVAESLKSGGYRTYMSGKWHVGGNYNHLPETWDLGNPERPRPTDRGFDRYFGTLAGAGSFWNPHTLMLDDDLTEPDSDDWFYTDAISDYAVKWIDEHERDREEHDDAPFFLYVAYTAPHWPLHARPEDIAKYADRYHGGWDELRGERSKWLAKDGVLDEKWTLSPRDEKAPAWQNAAHREWEALRMSVYAAQIDNMDQGIGKILNALDRHGIADDTLVMFLSDNGGCAEFLREDGEERRGTNSGHYPMRNGQPAVVGNIPNRAPGGADTFMSYDLPWANASNTPFRLYKHWVHEGGISTPFVARWGNGIKPNGITHRPSHLVDITATCLDLAGVQHASATNASLHKPEGESLVPLFQGDHPSRIAPLYWEHEGNRAVRDGEWKLVSKHPGDWELYNIGDDRTELTNLADTRRDKLDEMVEAYEEWAGRAGVLPWEEYRALQQRG